MDRSNGRGENMAATRKRSSLEVGASQCLGVFHVRSHKSIFYCNSGLLTKMGERLIEISQAPDGEFFETHLLRDFLDEAAVLNPDAPKNIQTILHGQIGVEWRSQPSVYDVHGEEGVWEYDLNIMDHSSPAVSVAGFHHLAAISVNKLSCIVAALHVWDSKITLYANSDALRAIGERLLGLVINGEKSTAEFIYPRDLNADSELRPHDCDIAICVLHGLAASASGEAPCWEDEDGIVVISKDYELAFIRHSIPIETISENKLLTSDVIL